MPWIARPFDYYGTSSNQILEDLTQANDNFEILGKCFVNDDPTTGKVKVANTVDGFHASQTPTPNAIPVADSTGMIDTSWLNASDIPTPNAIPVADANGKIDTGWLKASTTPTANTIPVADSTGKISADWVNLNISQTPAPNTIPVADSTGKIANGWLNLNISQTPTPNAIPQADANGKIDTGWVNASATPLANQIPVLNANANLILPNTSLIQTNTYTFRRVDLSGATSDYPLAVGEEAIINFTNATSVPLRIATQDGTVYELHLIPSNPGGTSGGNNQDVWLNPNNTTYSDAFYYAEMYRSSSGISSGYYQYSNFRIGNFFTAGHYFIINRTSYKNIMGMIDLYGWSMGYPTAFVISTDWRDTTTPWTSLGTITFPQPTSGQILIRRLV